MTVSITITLDDQLGRDLDAAVTDGNRDELVAEAIRDLLDRKAMEAARSWQASLTGADAAALADFDSAWASPPAGASEPG